MRKFIAAKRQRAITRIADEFHAEQEQAQMVEKERKSMETAIKSLQT